MTKYIKNPIIVSILFFVFSVIFLFIFLNKTSRDSLIEQIQHRQQMSVRAGANSIDTFLNAAGKSAVILADNPDRKVLDSFTRLWADTGISGLVVTDKNGIAIINSNPQGTRDTGTDLSGRDYFKWANKVNDSSYSVFPPVVAKLGPAKGKYIVAVSSPLFSNNHFNGVLTIAIPLSELTQKYIQNLKVLDSSRVYLITKEGEIIYSDRPELTGKNIQNMFNFDFLGKDKVVETFLSELQRPDETKLKLAMPNFENNKLESYLISAVPISVSDQLWKLVVVTPEKDLLMFTYKTFRTQMLGTFIIVAIFIALTLRMSRDSGYHEAVVDEHKIHKITS